MPIPISSLVLCLSFLFAVQSAADPMDGEPKEICNGSSLYHKESQKCYESGTQGPCPNNLILFQIPFGEMYGECDCPQKGDGVGDDESPFPNIYYKKTDRCYPAYTQAHCGEANWLTFTDTTKVKCTQNPCVNSTLVNPILVKGQCVSYGSVCFKDDSKYSEFPIGVVIPPCGGSGESYELSIGNIKCGQGQIVDVDGECREVIEIE